MYNNNNNNYRGNDGSYYPKRENRSTYSQENQNQFKKSGATYSKIRNGNFEGETIVNAWRKTKFGLMIATCTPYNGQSGNGSKIVESVNEKTGHVKEYKKMICTIQNKSMGTSQTYHVLMNVQTQVIVISELSLCITPNGDGKTASGKRVKGYFGRNYRN